MSKVLTSTGRAHSFGRVYPRMTSLTRLLGYALLLLLAFLAATVGAQSWLRQQTQRLRAEAVEARRAQFEAVLAAMPRPVEAWDDAYQRRLGDMIGGTVTLQLASAPLAARDPSTLSFEREVSNAGALLHTARVSFPAPPTARLLATYQEVTIGLLLFGLVLLMAGALFAVMNWRTADAGDSAPAALRDSSRLEMGSLEHLAKTSVARGAQLDLERDGRRLAEEDALFKQTLLNQSLEDKIRLGHDLHDGIIQSLYASGLTIESARALAKTDPAAADRQLAECLQNLNASIRDVRNYITGLSPEKLRVSGFAQAIAAHLAELGSGRTLRSDLKFDDDAIARLTPEQSTEALQVAREAISNSLRHGGASFVTVRLHQSDRELGLLVQDNGIGFDPARREGFGHGLANMRRRAARVGATVRVESQPGNGTRVIFTVPFQQPPS
jgi:signal transduction histidine kinase